jgi:hypothetical protein
MKSIEEPRHLGRDSAPLVRRRAVAVLLSLFCALAAAAPALRAQVVSNDVFTWAPTTFDSTFTHAGNWSSDANTAPDANADLVFGQASQTNVTLPFSADVNSITFTDYFPSYHLRSSASEVSLTIGSGGLNVGYSNGSTVDFDFGLPVNLNGSQTWTINSHTPVHDRISGNADSALTKSGSDSLLLDGDNTFSGGPPPSVISTTARTRPTTTATVSPLTILPPP